MASLHIKIPFQAKIVRICTFVLLCMLVAPCRQEDLLSTFPPKSEDLWPSTRLDAKTSAPNNSDLKRPENERSLKATEANGIRHIHEGKGEKSEDLKLTSRENDNYDISRNKRAAPEGSSVQIGHRLGRGALNNNFLRFGRGGLNKNFLRFGRGGLNNNFLRFGRGGLNSNFLRFGRGNEEENEVPETGDKTESQQENESQFLQEIEALKEKLNTDGKNAGGDTPASDPPAGDNYDMYDSEDDAAKIKRGSLNNNFLRYGRLYYPNFIGGKRGSLDRNFLRFGKRNGGANSVEVSEENGDTAKVKREVYDDDLAPPASSLSLMEKLSEEESENLCSFDCGNDNQPKPVDFSGLRNRRSVLFLTSPWLTNDSGWHKPGNDRKLHSDSIRRRSLDNKGLAGLRENFIRFGRR